jgi:hypothetical protein
VSTLDILIAALIVTEPFVVLRITFPPSVSMPLERTCKSPLLVVIVFAPFPSLFRERTLVVFVVYYCK